MFEFLSKSNLYAPTRGKTVPIEQVEDELFSKKLLGDGMAIICENNDICAPCDGELTMVFPDGHAFGINNKDGIEVLVHIGLDSAALNGKGCKILKQAKSKIKKGDKIIEIDLEYFKQKNIVPIILMVITNCNNKTCIFEYPEFVLSFKTKVATIL